MPSATFNGQTYNFPEGTSQDDMVSYINAQNSSHDAAPAPSEAPSTEQTPQPQEDGSIWNTMTSGWSRMGRNTLAAMTTDKDSSDYEMYKAKNASKEYHDERSKLGTLTGFAADVGTYAPVVAAGIAAPELGAAAMGGLATADTLAQQQEAGQGYDMGNALVTGIASGATDYATAGLAGRGVNVARQLTSPTKRVAAELGSQAAQAGASNAAMTGYQNVALGRPWDTNVAEAALIGGVAGAGMHGANMGARNMVGFAKNFNRPVNEDGLRQLGDANAVREETGGVHQDFANNSAEHANEYANQFNELMDMPISADSTGKIESMVDTSLGNNGADDAALSAMALARRQGAPLTAAAFDVDVGGRNLARDVMGHSERELEKLGGTLYADMQPLIFGKEKAKKAGYDSEKQMSMLKDSFDTGYADILQPLKDVRGQLRNVIQDRESSLGGGTLDPNYTVASNALKAIEDSLTKYTSGKAQHKLSDQTLRANAITAMRSLNELDMLRDLKNFDGSAFNPVKTAKAAYTYSDMFHKQNPSIHDYNPNILKSEGKESSKGAVAGDVATDMILHGLGLPPFRLASRMARNTLRPMKNRRALDSARGEADSFVDNAVATHEQNIQSHLDRGDTASAADSAGADLNSMGIHTEPAPEVVTAPEAVADSVAETNAVAPDADITTPVEAPTAPTDGVMARRPVNERPVAEVDPEVVAQQRAEQEAALSQDARVDSQRRTAPIEEEAAPVETAPEVDPSIAAAERAAQQEALSQDARVDSQRRMSNEDKARHAELMSKQDTERGLTRGEMDEFDNLSQRYRDDDLNASQEAPQESVSTTEGTSTTEAPEARTEAPTEPVDYKEKVMLPVRQRISDAGSSKNKSQEPGMSRRPEFKRLSDQARTAEQNIKAYAAQPESGITENGVYAAIDQHGGWDKVHQTMEERGQTMKQVLPSIVSEYKAKLADDARASAQRIADNVEETNVKSTEAQRDDAIKKLRADLKSASKDVTDEMIDRAIQKAKANVGEGEQYTARQVGNFVKQELSTIETPKAAEPKGKAEPKAKPIKQTAQDSHNELNEYASTVFGRDVPPEVRKAIDAATITRKRNTKGNALSDGSMKSVMNKMHDFIDDQVKQYEAALSKPDTAQPEQLASYRKKVADLNKQRQNVTDANKAYDRKLELRKEEAKRRADKAAASDKKANDESVDEAINKADAETAPSKDAVKQAIDAELKGKTDDQIQAISKAVLENIPDNLSSTKDPRFVAMEGAVEALSNNLRATNGKDPAKAIKLTYELINRGLKRKEEFPDNPDLWLSKADMHDVSRIMSGSDGGTAWYGLLYEKARLALFGSTNTTDLVIHGNDTIKARMNELRKKGQADKLASGVIGDSGIDAPGIK